MQAKLYGLELEDVKSAQKSALIKTLYQKNIPFREFKINKINEEVTVDDIPLNKWINVIIRVDEQHQMDIYINGRLVKRHMLSSVPKQNYGDIYIAYGGAGTSNGFDGYISNLMYYNYALGTAAIQSITHIGPNTSYVDKQAGSSIYSKLTNFFSLKWYFAGQGDQYNPR